MADGQCTAFPSVLLLELVLPLPLHVSSSGVGPSAISRWRVAATHRATSSAERGISPSGSAALATPAAAAEALPLWKRLSFESK
jgi:hypothetical protein